ncbi:hypothetical protein LMG9964_06424 [Paraburkholderia phenoliruptrix]|uniref:Uncharacterized protein n=1 Tax=Paraburkholderia phenoliruptrix TaxID=252970 RepID=A0A6J5KJ41_9BURK|nr:hypothetical protein LMG9964_06424 [Paraburkholderia phenoliruptrix]
MCHASNHLHTLLGQNHSVFLRAMPGTPVLPVSADVKLTRVRVQSALTAALVYWLGIAEPSHEPNFFDATRKFGSLMQLVLPDERPGVFVKRDAVHTVQDCGVVKRPVFKDRSSLDVRYDGPCSDLYHE